MEEHTHVAAILLMGGIGERLGKEIPKQFYSLKGKKLYLYTLETFACSQLFSTIILVYPRGFREEIERETAFCSPLLVEGGGSRQASSFKGLKSCPPGTHYVLIHDAVRPFVSQAILEENIRLVQQHKAVDTCIPSADTVVVAKSGKHIDAIPLRAHYLRGQTPQTFEYKLILKAHQATQQENATDDCSLVLEAGHPVFIAQGSEENIKITTPFDLKVAEFLIGKKSV